MAGDEEVSKLKAMLAQAEAKIKEAEANMYQAALYGQDLLEKNMSLETSNEELQQEKHELNLKFQAKLNVEKGMMTEVEHLREAVKQLEAKLESRDLEDEEKWSKREEIWKAKLTESEVCVQAAEARQKLLEERLEVAEKQLREASEAMDQSVGGQSLSSEFAELHSQNVDLLKEKQSLETELARSKADTQAAVTKGHASAARLELLQRELEEAQCSISSYSRAAEAAKTEAMELQAQLDAVAIDNLNEDGKGNSLFSEVNDRREKVETQLKVYEEKYEVLKNNYDLKMADLQKTKMHNAKLLSIAGNSYKDSGHTSRLEELLTSERDKNKRLRERLDTLEKLSEVGAEPVVVPGHGGMVTSGAVTSEDTTVLVPHTQSQEYTYLSSLLSDTQNSNRELKKQLQEQFRLSLEDSDKLRDMTRKVNTLEASQQKLKAENYTLKIHIDELKCKKGDAKVTKKEPKLIHEKLSFAKPTEKEPPAETKQGFVLKETVVNNKTLSSNVPRDNNSVVPSSGSQQVEKENVSNIIDKSDKPKKKAASFADNVEKISAEGEKETSLLQSQSPKEKEKTRPNKPQGKKKFGAANSVFVKEEDNAAECKQQ